MRLSDRNVDVEYSGDPAEPAKGETHIRIWLPGPDGRIDKFRPPDRTLILNGDKRGEVSIRPDEGRSSTDIRIKLPKLAQQQGTGQPSGAQPPASQPDVTPAPAPGDKSTPPGDKSASKDSSDKSVAQSKPPAENLPAVSTPTTVHLKATEAAIQALLAE